MRKVWIIQDLHFIKFDAKQQHMERMGKYFKEYKERCRRYDLVDSTPEWQYARVNDPSRYKFLQDQFDQKMRRARRR